MGTLDCRLATKYIRSLGISSKTISSNSETPFFFSFRVVLRLRGIIVAPPVVQSKIFFVKS